MDRHRTLEIDSNEQTFSTMAKTIKGRVQHPAYTAAALKAKNPVLLKGEVVYESDTTLHKVGDGATPWNALAYARGGGI